MVMSILGLHSVHSYLGQLPSAWFCLQQYRSLVLGKHGAIHHWVRSDKPQDLVRELLRSGEAASIHFTGTLQMRWWERKGRHEVSEEGGEPAMLSGSVLLRLLHS